MALIAENISKSFGGLKVIDSFSHEFAEGGYTVIMGASGCGKSTLLSLLMGIQPPDSGKISGNDVKKSAVFQEDRLCENLSVISNLRLVLGRKADRERLCAALDAVGLAEHINKLARELSGGMKRRLALVRALLAEYELLFLDEPFKGLDEQTKELVMSYCKKMTENKTVILVTHDREEAGYFGGDMIEL